MAMNEARPTKEQLERSTRVERTASECSRADRYSGIQRTHYLLVRSQYVSPLHGVRHFERQTPHAMPFVF
jgi:hypothetical protein